MQIDALWDECTTDEDIQTALENLPRSLDETYARCLQRIDRRQSRFAQTILRWVAATITPFQVDQLREALAIDPNTGCLDRNRMPPRQEIVKCCCNLITSNYGQILLAHHSVRQFLETRLPSGRFTWASYKLHTARLELGALCVNHLTSADYGLNLQHCNLGECSRIAIGEPTMKTLIEGPLPSWTRRFLLRPKPATMFLPSKASSPPSDMELSSFFHYAKAHWAPLTRSISKASPHWDNFRRLALEPNLSWRLHPWPPLGESPDSHYFGLLGWAIVHHHVPLLDLLLRIQDYKPRNAIFNMPFYQYNNLPALHLASRTGNAEIIKRLLEVCNPNKTDNNHQTALHHAAETGRADASLLLIQRQVSLKAQDNRGRAALHYAAESGHVSVVQTLIDVGVADVNQRDNIRQTALFLAAGNGHETVVRMLAYRGADMNMEDNNGWTPLCIAADNLQDQTIRTFIELGEDINMEDGVGRKVLDIVASKLSGDVDSKPNANQAVFLAAKQGHEAVLQVLLACGVDINGKDFDGWTPLTQAAASGDEVMAKLLLEKGADIEATDTEYGWTPLSWALIKGKEAVLKLLLEKGADIEACAGCQQTPLSQAAHAGDDVRAKLLLENGAYVETKDQFHQTPLSRAAKEGNNTVAKLLLEKGAHVDAKDCHNRTPLSWAAEGGHEAVTELLLENGANIEAKDGKYSQTPLSLAAMNGHEAVTRLLLEKGADFETQDTFYEQTPLSWAAKGGHEAVAKLLLEKGAYLETEDGTGRTPLSWAAQGGHKAVVKLLLDKDCDVQAHDDNGRTPQSWACKGGHYAISRLLHMP